MSQKTPIITESYNLALSENSKKYRQFVIAMQHFFFSSRACPDHHIRVEYKSLLKYLGITNQQHAAFKIEFGYPT